MLSPHASSILMLAGLALALFLLLRRPGARLTKPRESILRANASIEANRDRALADAPVDTLRWQVEMHETARELKGELDSKMSALQALVLMARKESTRLEAALRRADSVDAEIPRDSLAKIASLADPEAIADPHALAHTAAQIPAPVSSASTDLFDADRKALAVARLADQKRSPVEIAQQLDLPIGEVELLLSWRPL